MKSESKGLRNKLLAAEPLNAEAARRFEEEVAAMWNKKMTKWERLNWIGSLVAAIWFVVLGAVMLWHGGKAELYEQVMWWIFTLGNLGFVILALAMLIKGTTNLDWQMRLGKISPAAVLIITIVLLMRAMDTPTIEALARALLGLVCFILASSINLWNRIVKSDMATREQFLRLELLLMDREGKGGGDARSGT